MSATDSKRPEDRQPSSNPAGRVTVPELVAMKGEGRKIAALTAYDHPTARMLGRAGADVILVGDSLGMVLLGYRDTLPVTMDEMLHHTSAVARGASRALVVGDMPFLSYQASPEDAIRNGGRFLKEAGAQAVKLEGAGPHIIETVSRLTEVGIPVMGHLGLTPQFVHQFGGYKMQGKDPDAAEHIVAQAKALEEAGAFAVVLEVIPADLANRITKALSIPTIGIGAGKYCDGQVIVTYDMLGLSEHSPSFVKRYAEIGKTMAEATERFVDDVRGGRFPE